MFAVIRHYHFRPQDSAEIDKMVRENFVPLIKKAKGFVRYYWLDTGKGEGASLSVFQDKAGADEVGPSGRGLYQKSHVQTHYSETRSSRRVRQSSRLSA